MVGHGALHASLRGEHMTICLTPGQEVSHNTVANDQGDSHTWATSC
ncbi:hypothetical protein [Streptomyces sp. NBC_00306]|nr:hypothetical protein [Streptomyces sp. NBC_00306]